MRSGIVVPMVLAALAATPMRVLAGPIDPPNGPVAPTHKTLTEVEPRIPINTTNTPGDADSLFRISQPGSYYLTANVAGRRFFHGIEIAADNVSIDLMGCSMVGVAGSLDGIRCDVPRNNISIRNGVVRDFDGIGIAVSSPGQIGLGGVLADLLVSDNGSWGVFPNDQSTVRDCVSRSNAGSGFLAADGVLLRSCVAAGNLAGGFQVSSSATLADCAAVANSGTGFLVAGSSTITNCTANLNGGDGFVTIGSVLVSGCVASENMGDGIEAWFQCTIIGNACSNNGFTGVGAGIRIVAGTQSRIEGNSCSSADRGIVVESSRNLIIKNNCSGNTINYEIAEDNRYGPIIDITAAGTPPVNGNSGDDTIGTTHPWANFAH